MMAVFCLTGLLLFADQNLMAPNLTAIAKGRGRAWVKGGGCKGF